MMICTCAHAQVLTVKFTGRDQTGQHYVKLDHVKTFNLDQLWEEVLYFPDTTLVLGGVGIIDYGNSATSQLEQNVPNPFDGTTHFTLYLREGADVLLEIFDLMGKSIVNQHYTNLSAGAHLFSTNLINPQVYILKASVKNEQMHLKMVNKGYGAENSINHVSASFQNGEFESGAKDSQSMGIYPFQNGDELQHTGYAVVNGVEYKSETITQRQNESETMILPFNLTPTVSTYEISSITSTSANCGGNVTYTGEATVVNRGICWSTSNWPTINNSHTSDGSGTGSFTSTMTNLTPGTLYHVRAYAISSADITGYGEQVTFNTPATIPSVTTSAVTNITDNSATCGGHITSDGGAAITARGVCWSTNQNPTIADYHTPDGSGTGAFTSSITGLSPNTTYYVRAYATNSEGTGYGEQEMFTTIITPPIVLTLNVSNVTSTTATCNGNVTSTGGTTVTARGFCWSTSSFPTTNNNHTNNGQGAGNYTSDLTGLTPGTIYYVRAYATNSAGTAYGGNICFSTLANTPSVTTSTVSNITDNSATCGGNVTSDGGSTVTARGVCWSTSQNPTINDAHTSSGTGTGSFSCSITGLTHGTTYYVRAYAINNVGTTYGENIFFSTLANKPTVITSTISNITDNSAICGGNVTDDGGATITTRGVCWSINQNPTINDAHIANGTGTGSFSCNITGLSQGTTYYVRTYATNTAGTAYGNQINFTTIVYGQPCENVPTVTDYDGNTYNTVKIGNQCWMKENLRATHYTNGESIPLGYNLSSTACRYYPNNDGNNVSAYGYLYNWQAVMHGTNSSTANPSGVQGICPDGWHVPSDSEWTQLTNYVSSQASYVCNNDNTHIAKSLASSMGWNSSSATCAVGNNPSSNNATGFSALPAGHIGISNSGVSYFGYNASVTFWSATGGNINAFTRHFDYYIANVQKPEYNRNYGLSVRCLRD